MSDPATYWRDALEGRLAPITEEAPQTGFYRKKSAGNFWLPVALWREQDIWWAAVGKEEPNGSASFVIETWLACARHPVTEKAYRHAVATGQWPGEAPAAMVMGHNQPPEGFEALVARINEEVSKAQAWLNGRSIATQADADRCETWANEFVKLKKQAEAEHKVEKAPHLEAGKKVDAKYKPLIERAQQFAAALKAAVTPFLKQREEEKRAAAAQAIAKGETAARYDTKAKTSGASGRAVGLRTVRSAVITDLKAAALYFAEANNPELRELLQAICDRCARAGTAPIPGVEFKEEKKAA